MLHYCNSVGGKEDIRSKQTCLYQTTHTRLLETDRVHNRHVHNRPGS